MLASITPLGERGRDNRWGVTAAWYVAGSVLGGATSGAAFGAVGALVRIGLEAVGVSSTARTVGALLVLAVLCAVGLAFDLHLLGLELPTNHRQVNERWLDTYRSWVYGGGFGFQLGLGLVTIVTVSATYLTFAAAFLSGSVLGGLVIGVTFGLARALPLLWARHADDFGAIRDLHRRSAAWEGPVRTALLGCQGLALALATVLALGVA
ncbi:MAG: sulfite exporter TauE/SafE family protein [Acidimicrobiales bacterium]